METNNIQDLLGAGDNNAYMQEFQGNHGAMDNYVQNQNMFGYEPNKNNFDSTPFRAEQNQNQFTSEMEGNLNKYLKRVGYDQAYGNPDIGVVNGVASFNDPAKMFQTYGAQYGYEIPQAKQLPMELPENVGLNFNGFDSWV